MKNISRREILRRSAFAAGTIMAMPAYLPAFGASQAAKIEIDRIQYVSNQPDIGFGWPTVGRRADNGELLVSCSGGRQSHVCPF
ncbi:MAG: exo-alpha-sialidase, partial [Planctomycetia bacterium]|nr:exo-alpha-sialidase [Planctomycetia bacterium]